MYPLRMSVAAGPSPRSATRARRGHTVTLALAALHAAGCLAQVRPQELKADAVVYARPDRDDQPDAAPLDATLDAGAIAEAGVDTGVRDTGVDAGARDTGVPDAGPLDPTQGVGALQPVQFGFTLSEGPVWRPNDTWNMTDILSSRIMVIVAPNQIMDFRGMTNQGNGLANDIDGSLLMCEHVSRSVVRIRQNGNREPIAERWNNLQFNSPNDLVVRRDGTIYFTDPPYALNAQRTRQIPFNGLFRITTTGSVAVGARFERGAGEGMMSATLPNGLELSPDERILYVADSATGIVWQWDVNADGSLANQREFVRTQGLAPDGITVDVDGNVYVASAAGIEVYRPNATRWGIIGGWPQGVRPANLAFGGPTMDYLLVAAERNAYFLQLRARGLRR